MNYTEATIPYYIHSEHLETIQKIKFTLREMEVIAYILHGRSAKRIAANLSITPKTVENYIRNIMLKIGCNSREGVINFIEKTGKYAFVRKFYVSLMLQTEFENCLKVAAKNIANPCMVNLIINKKNKEGNSVYLQLIVKHLELINCQVSLVCQPDIDFVQSLFKIEPSKEDVYTFKLLMSEEFKNIFSESSFPSQQEQLKQAKTFFMVLTKKGAAQELENIKITDQVCLLYLSNYFFSVFQLLAILRPEMNLTQLSQDFQTKSQQLYHSEDEYLPKEEDALVSKLGKENGRTSLNKFNNKLYPFIALFSLVCIITWLFFNEKYTFFNSTQTEPIRSELVIPIHSVLLERPRMIQMIREIFKNPKDIQAVALTGIGGIGKTTLARQYGRALNTSIVWEIQADTKESLINSFESLAYALATTEADKEILKKVQDLKAKDKQDTILRFVKNRLKQQSDWLLIYDNVEDLATVSNFFPNNPQVWGKGKVILTTTDENIQNNKYINATISVEELNQHEKIELFIKIINLNNPINFTEAQRDKAREFLKDIPPFPLDVSVAAYYIKATNTSYEQYLHHLRCMDENFEAMQEGVLKDVSEYTRNRYKIVALSIKKITEANPDFSTLLLLISLISPQNIPRQLLEKYKNDIIADNFIYNLKKYSLITNETSSLFDISATISVHRNAQEICLSYLKPHLQSEQGQSILQSLAQTLAHYVTEIIETENIQEIVPLIDHCEIFLSHNKILPSSIIGIISQKLGHIYSYLGNYIKAKKELERSLEILKQNNQNSLEVAHVQELLGNVYRELGDYNSSIIALEQSLQLYQKFSHNNPEKIAHGLAYLGSVYRELGNYGKAKALTEESLAIYQRSFPENRLNISQTLLRLSDIYKELGCFEKAKDLLEDCLHIYQSYYPKHIRRIANIFIHLGNIHRKIGHYKEAKNYLENGIKLYSQSPENLAHTAIILKYLTYLYKDMGDYKKALSASQQSLEIYQKHFPQDQDDISWGFANLGDIYNKLGYFQRAIDLLEKSLKINSSILPHKHNKIAHLQEKLGKVYTELGENQKAKDLLLSSLTILKEYPENKLLISKVSVSLGSVYMALRKEDEAEALLRGSLSTYEEHYGKSHLKTAHILGLLGQLAFQRNNIQNAEVLLQKAIEILILNNHPQSHRLLETLAELYLKKAEDAASQTDIKLSQTLKKQAKNYLEQAWKIVEANYPPDSAHYIRLQEKLSAIERRK